MTRSFRPRMPLLPPMGGATFASLFHGVPGAPAAPTAPSIWAEDLPELVGYRLAALALEAAQTAGVKLDGETESRLRAAQRFDAATSLVIEATTPQVIEALEGAGINCVVTKGPGVARSYPRLAQRPFRDIDVVVRPMTFDRAMALLEGMGFSEPPTRYQPRAYFNRYCREAVNLVRADGASIDLHHHIPPWVWGARLSCETLLESALRISVDQGSLPIASPAHNLLVVCLHIISDKGGPGRELMIWRDLVALSAACEPQEVASEARAKRLDWCVGLVLRELPEFARPAELLEQIGEPHPSRADAIRLRLLLPPALGSRHQIAQGIRIPLPNALAFLAGYGLPSRQFLRRRFGSSGSLLRWWRDALFRLREAELRD